MPSQQVPAMPVGGVTSDLRLHRVVPPASATLDFSPDRAAAAAKPGSAQIQSTPPEPAAATEDRERKPVLPQSKLVRDPASFGYRRLLPFLNQMASKDWMPHVIPQEVLFNRSVVSGCRALTKPNTAPFHRSPCLSVTAVSQINEPNISGTTVRVEYGDVAIAADPAGAHVISHAFPQHTGSHWLVSSGRLLMSLMLKSYQSTLPSGLVLYSVEGSPREAVPPLPQTW